MSAGRPAGAQPPLEQARHRARRQPPAARVDEERLPPRSPRPGGRAARRRAGREGRRAAPPPPARRRERCAPCEPLPTHARQSRGEVHVLEVEARRLRDAQPRRVEELEERPLPLREGVFLRRRRAGSPCRASVMARGSVFAARAARAAPRPGSSPGALPGTPSGRRTAGSRGGARSTGSASPRGGATPGSERTASVSTRSRGAPGRPPVAELPLPEVRETVEVRPVGQDRRAGRSAARRPGSDSNPSIAREA